MVEKIGIEAKQSLAADNSLHMWFSAITETLQNVESTHFHQISSEPAKAKLRHPKVLP